MHHNHKPWRPSPAAKPSYLAASSQPNRSTNLAALVGATAAFTSTPKQQTPKINQLREQYEAPPDPPRNPQQVGTNTTKRSPSRGRHLSPVDALPSATLSASGTDPPVLSRHPSMIAARLASASPSPVRSSNSVSPLKEEDSDAVLKRKVEARLAEVPSRTETLPEHPTPIGKTLSLKRLNFDTIHAMPTKSNAVDDADTENRLVMETSPTRTKQPLPIAIPSRGGLDHRVPIPISHEPALPTTRLPTTVRSKPPTPAPRRGRPADSAVLKPNLTGSKYEGLSREEAINRMADAMVASSLASTRTSSPTKASPSPRFRHRSASAHNTYRIPSVQTPRPPLPHKPQRPLKQTLRKPSAEDDTDSVEITKRGRRHLVRKHPNMHSEGDRKRWRDKVSDSERKRYEGVFAANRGLLLKSAHSNTSPSRAVDPSSEYNKVANVVVRDIWERSRLPSQVLEQIYDLVAPNEASTLSREQFVIGMWLIDQQLKGRKLPVNVSESVWASVRHAQGIKISGRG